MLGGRLARVGGQGWETMAGIGLSEGVHFKLERA
jgi:hypothetical protein